MVSVTGIPSWSLPTSVSSTFPRNIMSFMSATTAIVVPSLNVLDWMTELPTLTGMSSIMPSIVERIWVLLISALRETVPSRTISRLSRCALEVLFRNPELCLRLLELVEGDDVLPVEFFGAFVFAPGLFQIYFRLLDSRFGVVEGTHLRNDLHGSDYVALPHHVACLLVQGGDDARNLGLDEYFVARFDLSGGYHELGDGVADGRHYPVDGLDRPRLVPQEDERPDEQSREQDDEQDSKYFLHNCYILNFHSQSVVASCPVWQLHGCIRRYSSLIASTAFIFMARLAG
mgnify:CR=1 FL=1